jgi:hypothetical protein
MARPTAPPPVRMSIINAHSTLLGGCRISFPLKVSRTHGNRIPALRETLLCQGITPSVKRPLSSDILICKEYTIVN